MRAVAAEFGVGRDTVFRWSRPMPSDAIDANCWICSATPISGAREPSYVYLLGQYLGDGHLVVRTRVPKLRIACADNYPGISSEVDIAMEVVCGHRPGSVAGTGCSERYSYWMHWPCVIPQYGTGPKHKRPIHLVAWQKELVAEHPWQLIRGLIHSDGCRSINRVSVNARTYSYPRYLFANESRDILAIMGDTLDLVGVEWRYNRPNSISVAKRTSVALLDEHVGPKS